MRSGGRLREIFGALIASSSALIRTALSEILFSCEDLPKAQPLMDTNGRESESSIL